MRMKLNLTHAIQHEVSVETRMVWWVSLLFRGSSSNLQVIFVSEDVAESNDPLKRRNELQRRDPLQD